MNARWDLDWHHRPSEEARLLNPAFCGELVVRAVRDYQRNRSAPFPLPVAFTILPLVLSPAMRGILPGRANTSFATWSAEHEAELADFATSVIRLRPVTREALLFMVQSNALAIGPTGLSIGSKPLRLSGELAAQTDETSEIRRAAALLGRWFANQGTPVHILQTMGVAP